jgi:hypothetical protein
MSQCLTVLICVEKQLWVWGRSEIYVRWVVSLFAIVGSMDCYNFMYVCRFSGFLFLIVAISFTVSHSKQQWCFVPCMGRQFAFAEVICRPQLHSQWLRYIDTFRLLWVQDMAPKRWLQEQDIAQELILNTFRWTFIWRWHLFL